MDQRFGVHSHAQNSRARRQIRSRLSLSLVLTLGFVVIEVIAGHLGNSLALLTDAAHNLTDVIALGLSWFALKLQTRPSGATNTYGFHRLGILVALVNSATLVLISLGVFYEAYRRLVTPAEVRAETLVFVGMMAVIVNLVTALLIRRPGESDLNVRSAFIHLMADVGSSAAAVVAGIVMYFTGADWLDPLAGVFIGFVIAYSAWRILRQAIDIVLESTPRDVDMTSLVQDMVQINGVLGVHDLHVWSLTADLRTMSAHVLTDDVPLSTASRIQRALSELLSEQYRITHATLQLECVGCDPGALYCQIDEAAQLQQK